MRDLVGAKVVAVHAHPDDEALWTGGLLASLAARGADVTVVTCTLGEQGEVIGDKYADLVADASDQLGGFRIHELADSLTILGAHGEFLGGPGRWRDSGMVGDPANERPRAFISAGEEAVEQLKEIINRIQPQLVVTYGPDGGYGHPDHIHAHELVHEVAEDPTVTIPRILWAVTDEAELARGLAAISTPPAGWRMPEEGELASVPTTDLAVPLDDDAFAKKVAAMKAHATQLWLADGSVSDVNDRAAFAAVSDPAAAPAVFALSNLIAQPVMRHEHYQLGAGIPLPTGTTDAMAGLTW